MVRLVVIIFLVALLPMAVVAQDKEYDKLEASLEDGKTEKVLNRALAMMENDKYRKEAYPSLWASKAYLNIAIGTDEKLKEKYPKALIESLKYANKAIGKDKDGAVMGEEKEFVGQLRTACIEDLNRSLPVGDMRHAYITLRGLGKVFLTDPILSFVRAVYDCDAGNAGEGEPVIERTLPEIRDMYAKDLSFKLPEAEDNVLRTAVLRRFDQLLAAGRKEEARKMLLNAKLFFPLHKEVEQRQAQLN